MGGGGGGEGLRGWMVGEDVGGKAWTRRTLGNNFSTDEKYSGTSRRA